MRDLMGELVTTAQMRAIEAAAIASGAVTGRELMERAGAGVVDALLAAWPALGTEVPQAVVLCGPGNNGGDGFVVARLLQARGWRVAALLLGDPRRLPADAAENHRLWAERGPLQVDRPGDDPQRSVDWLRAVIGAGGGDSRHVVIIDALFGIGLSRPMIAASRLVDAAADLAAIHPGTTFHHVAIDVPSGLCADSGRKLDGDYPGAGADPLAADLTVTFHAMKPAHVMGQGPELCGQVVICDIGLDSDVIGLDSPDQPGGLPTIEMESARDDWNGSLSKGAGSHKYDHGHALVLAGGSGRGGAARLAARAALRIGAGLVSLGCPPAALAENAARLDAVMLRSVADVQGLSELLDDRRIRAVCIGPGLGTGRAEAALLAMVLGHPQAASPGQIRVARPAGAMADAPAGGQGTIQDQRAPRLVLDADALTLLAGDKDLFLALDGRCLLTPHAGEFARLFPDIAARLTQPARVGPAYSRIDATRDAAARAGCTILFKGRDTVIAGPDGRTAVSAAVRDRAAPWLATAGSGDVLAGMICGLMARGWSPFDAASAGAFLHVEAARAFGPGLIAEDLPDMIPRVMRSLGVD